MADFVAIIEFIIGAGVVLALIYLVYKFLKNKVEEENIVGK